MAAQVAVLRTRPETVVADYGRLMRLVKYEQLLPRDQELILKLNLSWTKYFPACSSQPWQVEGVVRALLDDGYDRGRIFPVENRTVVTNPVAGARNNKWLPILDRAGLPFIPLPEVDWITYRFRSPLLRLNQIFPERIQIPKMYVGKNVCHLPTVKCVHPDTERPLAVDHKNPDRPPGHGVPQAPVFDPRRLDAGGGAARRRPHRRREADRSHGEEPAAPARRRPRPRRDRRGQPARPTGTEVGRRQ